MYLTHSHLGWAVFQHSWGQNYLLLLLNFVSGIYVFGYYNCQIYDEQIFSPIKYGIFDFQLSFPSQHELFLVLCIPIILFLLFFVFIIAWILFYFIFNDYFNWIIVRHTVTKLFVSEFQSYNVHYSSIVHVSHQFPQFPGRAAHKRNLAANSRVHLQQRRDQYDYDNWKLSLD